MFFAENQKYDSPILKRVWGVFSVKIIVNSIFCNIISILIHVHGKNSRI